MLNMVAIAISRCLLVLLFLPFSALDKLLNFQQAVSQASEAISNRRLATFCIGAGFAVEVLMSVGIVSGIADRAAAFILAGYCGVTALLWKRFWKTGDFKLQGASRGRDVFWDFLKNLALGGGFLLLAIGPTAADFSEFVRHPLASTHPYSTRPDDSRSSHARLGAHPDDAEAVRAVSP